MNINEEDSFVVTASFLENNGDLVTASLSKLVRNQSGSAIPGNNLFGPIIIRKINPAGQEVWRYVIENSVGRVMHMKSTSSGDIIASGSFADTLKIGTKTFYAAEFRANAFVFSLDKDGKLKWANGREPLQNFTVYYNVFSISDNLIYIPYHHYTGFKNKLHVQVYDMDGDSVNNITIANAGLLVSEFQIDKDGSLYMAGTGGPNLELGNKPLGADTPIFSYLSYVAKLDRNFEQLWSHTFRYVTFDLYPKLAFNDDLVAFMVDTMPQINGAGNHHILKYYDKEGQDIHKDSVGPNFFSRMHKVMGIIPVNDGFIFSTLKGFSTISIQYVNSAFEYEELATIEMNPGVTYPWFTSNDSVIHYTHNYLSNYLVVNGQDSISNEKVSSYGYQQAFVKFSYENETSSVQQIARFEPTVYPNPTNGLINLNLNLQFLGEQIEVIDAHGKMVYRSNVDMENVVIDLSGQANGIYFIRAGSLYKKVVKM